MLDGKSGWGKLTQGCGSGLLLGGMIYLGLASLVSELLSDSDSDEMLIFLVVSTSGVGLFCLGMIGFVVSWLVVVSSYGMECRGSVKFLCKVFTGKYST
ncbi:hypothetical protein DPMN_114216 [Dreissena polymorpha]|uniref:Uncharacterized protein n=1 Tax=Dreissena polymorpha TaxID=45954 RepID=A0A9D4KJL3_DREPO|nr:hypothetical protein DPMN_114216 [Dreissena polymorpha]